LKSVAAVMLIWDKIYGSVRKSFISFATKPAQSISQQVPDWAEASLTSSVFAGSIAGMLTLGYLGDIMGRQAAMTLTLSLMSFGAMGSALLAWGSMDSIASLVICWRFVLGFGIGALFSSFIETPCYFLFNPESDLIHFFM
jgi:MFS family permease